MYILLSVIQHQVLHQQLGRSNYLTRSQCWKGQPAPALFKAQAVHIWPLHTIGRTVVAVEICLAQLCSARQPDKHPLGTVRREESDVHNAEGQTALPSCTGCSVAAAMLQVGI